MSQSSRASKILNVLYRGVLGRGLSLGDRVGVTRHGRVGLEQPRGDLDEDDLLSEISRIHHHVVQAQREDVAQREDLVVGHKQSTLQRARKACPAVAP